MSEFTDAEAWQEYSSLSEVEQSTFWGCLAVLLDDGRSRVQAEREAVAAVLQHRRLHAPRIFTVPELEAIGRVARLFERRGQTPEAAEQSAYQQALKRKRPHTK